MVAYYKCTYNKFQGLFLIPNCKEEAVLHFALFPCYYQDRGYYRKVSTEKVWDIKNGSKYDHRLVNYD